MQPNMRTLRHDRKTAIVARGRRGSCRVWRRWAVQAWPGPPQYSQERFVAELKRLESESGGRLGVTLLDASNGQRVGHRMDERFPMCSTFKVLASGAVLHGVDAGKESLARRIYFSEADLVTYSPETQKHVGPDGMTVAELCKAAMTLSDNTAGNLLLASIGGPQGLTVFARLAGRRHDAPRPHRDGTQRSAARRSARYHDAERDGLRFARVGVGRQLSAKSRAQLAGWLAANTTGGKRLRAGLPAGWRVGDKTGSRRAGNGE